MRTNTWLALIAVGGAIQGYALRKTIRKTEEAQAKRDQERDALFRETHTITHRGQYAMWIQSPDGRRFETWAANARLVSQEIADRQDAWRACWEPLIQERAEQVSKDAAAYAAERVEHEKAARISKLVANGGRPDGAKVNRARGYWACLAWALGFILIAVFASLDANIGLPRYINWPAKTVLWTIFFGSPLVAMWFFGRARQYTLPKKDAERLREQSIQDYKSGRTSWTLPELEVPSWHRELSNDDLHALIDQINSVVISARDRYPRGNDLVNLRQVFRTRRNPLPEGTPIFISNLRDAFYEADQTWVENT